MLVPLYWFIPAPDRQGLSRLLRERLPGWGAAGPAGAKRLLDRERSPGPLPTEMMLLPRLRLASLPQLATERRLLERLRAEPPRLPSRLARGQRTLFSIVLVCRRMAAATRPTALAGLCAEVGTLGMPRCMLARLPLLLLYSAATRAASAARAASIPRGGAGGRGAANGDGGSPSGSMSTSGTLLLPEDAAAGAAGATGAAGTAVPDVLRAPPRGLAELVAVAMLLRLEKPSNTEQVLETVGSCLTGAGATLAAGPATASREAGRAAGRTMQERSGMLAVRLRVANRER